MKGHSTHRYRRPSGMLRFAFTGLLSVSPVLSASAMTCSTPSANDADASCSLPLKNGDFSQFRRVGSTRAVRWSRLAYWTVSHPQHNLGAQYDGLWGAELFAADHHMSQRVPLAPTAGATRFEVSFAAGAFGDANGQLVVGLVLTDATGKPVRSHGVTIRPPSSGWDRHKVSMHVSDVTEGSQLKIVFKRQGHAGGRQLVVADVRADQIVE